MDTRTSRDPLIRSILMKRRFVLTVITALAFLATLVGPAKSILAASGTTVRVSVSSAGVEASFFSIDPAISADGRWLFRTCRGTESRFTASGDTVGEPSVGGPLTMFGPSMPQTPRCAFALAEPQPTTQSH